MSTVISGFCNERFAPLRDAFVAHFDEGLEIGASLAVTHRGKTVVDLWAGYADPEKTRPWEKDTIVPVMSTTKIMVSISILMLVDRGLIDLDEPIARYWPEFAQGGKEEVTLRDALTHRAGVPAFASPVPWERTRDWAEATARLAAEPHWFGGRRQISYHAGTFGFVVGELIRRVDGRMPSVFFQEEIAEKSGADFHICLKSQSDMSRVARIRMPPPERAPPDASASEAAAVARRNAAITALPALDSWLFLSAEAPSGSGVGNGRSIARVGAIIAGGGALDGVRYLSSRMVEEAAREQVYEEAPVMGWIRLGLGFGLDSKEFPAPSPSSMHWGGYGGSWAFMDPKAQVSFGYTPNNFMGSSREDPRIDRFMATLRGLLSTL